MSFFSCIFDQVGSAISQIANLQGLVEQAVGKMVESYVQEVVGGVWVGKGADAFVQDVSSMLVPKINKATGFTHNIQTNLKQAMDIVHTADSDATKIAGELGDLFEGIF